LKVDINSIVVGQRLRQSARDIDQLAADLKRNGLINPITVAEADGAYYLIAGYRRLLAAQRLEWDTIDVCLREAQDGKSRLHLEFSENEERVPFTVQEQMEYARVLEELERPKALARKQAGTLGSNEPKVPAEGDSAESTGRINDIVAAKIGWSTATYKRAKFITKHAPELIEALDRGELTIAGAYAKAKAANPPKPPSAKPKAPTKTELKRLRADLEYANDVVKRLTEVSTRLTGDLRAAELQTNQAIVHWESDKTKWACEADAYTTRIAALEQENAALRRELEALKGGDPA